MKQGTERMAKMAAEQLKQVYESNGFTIYWRQMERELNRARLWARAASIHARTNGTSAEKLGLEVMYRNGYVECLERVMEIKDELLEELEAGRIPWEAKK